MTHELANWTGQEERSMGNLGDRHLGFSRVCGTSGVLVPVHNAQGTCVTAGKWFLSQAVMRPSGSGDLGPACLSCKHAAVHVQVVGTWLPSAGTQQNHSHSLPSPLFLWLRGIPFAHCC